MKEKLGSSAPIWLTFSLLFSVARLECSNMQLLLILTSTLFIVIKSQFFYNFWRFCYYCHIITKCNYWRSNWLQLSHQSSWWFIILSCFLRMLLSFYATVYSHKTIMNFDFREYLSYGLLTCHLILLMSSLTGCTTETISVD